MDTHDQLRGAEDGYGDINIDVDDRSGGAGGRVAREREQGEEQCHSYPDNKDEQRDFHSKGIPLKGMFTREQNEVSLGRGARACSACAVARRKCSGGNPCDGCVKRSIDCVAHSNTATTIIRRKESIGVSHEPSNEMVGIVNDQAGERSTSPQSQALWSKIISPIDTQPQINPRSSTGRYHRGFEMENIDVTDQQMNIQNLGPGAHQQFDQFTSPNNRTSDQISEDSRRNPAISYDHQSTSSSILPLQSITNLDEATNPLMNSNDQTSSQLHIPNTNLSNGLLESAGSWTQYNPSSINWLPYDWAPNYQLEDDTSAMGIVDGTTDINGPSPIDISEDSIPRNPPYSINNATIFTPSSQRQGRIQIDNSPRLNLSSEGGPTTPNSHTTQNTGRYYVDGHGSRCHLLDCMWNFHFQIRPSLSLDDGSVLLPCQEVLWEAGSAIDWKQLLSCSSIGPTLHHALQRMYTEKRLQSSMGGILPHPPHPWSLPSHLGSRKLSQTTPHTMDAYRSKNNLSSTSPLLLPFGSPVYRHTPIGATSACDCLDILHWHANSVIGAASGMEHPTVLHLHLARVVLLTPFAKIDEIAQYISAHLNPQRLQTI
ncbi:hypothetical protein DID88_005145 [Monilinia fructigena]|uniref:Zn(2)-C6 fungal-type domain-containing protein n=1 Tax=Monilinia fructigena TaxID=38457 RepID=A0A395IE14_9HELO|nr:hypothetical protein DID88_005145 [Monilinia fructigena]